MSLDSLDCLNVAKTFVFHISFSLITTTNLFPGLGTRERGVDRHCEKAEVGRPVEMGHVPHQVDGRRKGGL